MPSYSSGSSSSRHSWDSSYYRADGEGGMRELCWCGLLMVIRDSKSEATRGRKMYTCPDWTFERPCPNHNHIWKWWEDAVTEELSTLKIRVDNATSGIKSLHNMGVVRNCLPETISFETHQSEIRQLREQLSGMEREIGRMKELIANRGDGYVIIAFFMLFAVFSYLYV
ncbi:uncharacterized protein At4g04775-like [Eutrema salsugineum]|uniref:uncharacterized protein At4g04775-like n=1 Tax=Eutrema salsugineum TaxID=72664 RepID=UPI000CED7A38|nr:uncharacterized protein At4g04775-like [Eutrema salsugineum]